MTEIEIAVAPANEAEMVGGRGDGWKLDEVTLRDGSSLS
jgi:hypothetical protein